MVGVWVVGVVGATSFGVLLDAHEEKMARKRKYLFWLAPCALIIGSFAVSGKRTNPPVTNEVAWNSPKTKDVFYRACADCHSHETRWPWYAKFAPVSWRIIEDVEEGREHFNISVPDMGESDEAAEEVEEGYMPLDDYVRYHPEAHLDESEKAVFIAGLLATFGREPN